MADTILRAVGISKTFHHVHALKGVSFDLMAGEVHGLMGENGAGKSTFIKILTGAYTPDAGSLELAGTAVSFATPTEAKMAGVSAVYQEFSLINSLTVAENICVGRYPRRRGMIDWRRMEREAAGLLARFRVSASPRDKVGELGIATRQMVEIIKAYAQHDVRVLIMDEPTAALDDNETKVLFEFVASLKAAGVAIIYVSHRLNEIKKICDRVTVFRNGERVATERAADVEVDTIVSLMLGRRMQDFFPPKTPRRGPPVLSVKDLQAPKLRGISFDLHEGELLGIAGLVGAGKTELLLTIFGGTAREAGSVKVGDKALTGGSPREAVAAGLGLIPESRKEQGLVLPMSVRANITLASLDTIGKRVLGRKREDAAAQAIVEQLEVRPTAIGNKVVNLSGGNQQKIVIGKWLARGCRILLFDEPTRGVDVGAKFQIYQLLAELAREGAAVIVASSEVEEIAGICHRVLVLRDGQVSAELNGAQVSPENILSVAAFGEAGALN